MFLIYRPDCPLYVALYMIFHSMLNWLHVRHQLSTLKAKVDDQFSGMKIFIEDSFKNIMFEYKNATKC